MYPEIINLPMEAAFMCSLERVKQDRLEQGRIRRQAEIDAADQRRRFEREIAKAKQIRALWDIDC